jgi:phosphatidylserine/phosphatidylglycerophosphate/cardiolipin synthase-like enzyme
MTLADVATPDLERLRALVASRALACPLSETALSAHGLQADVTSLFALDRQSVLVALDLLLAERARTTRAPLELVWTGPQSTSPQTRDTAIVLAELFLRAQKRVLLAGYVFTNGAAILKPLHEAMVHGVTTRFFLDIPGHATTIDGIPNYVSDHVDRFVRDNWPFGSPYPKFFYDPRTASPIERAILHAKCAVVDGRYSLVTSANFTTSGQEHNIEVGVLIDDEVFSSKLESHFNALVSAGALVEAVRV